MNPTRLLLALLAFVFLAARPALADDPLPPELVPPCPVLRAGDVTEPAPHHDVKVFFPWTLGVDEGSLGDGDLVARGPNDYLQRAGLVSVEHLPCPFPAYPTDPSVDGAECLLLPHPEPMLVATYRFLPPGGNADAAWDEDDNGTYSVRLVEGAILTEAGLPVPAKYLGAFQVRIRPGPGEAVQPEAVRCGIGRAATEDPEPAEPAHFAWVRMEFADARVEVDWGTLTRRERSFVAEAKAVRSPLPPPGETLLDPAVETGEPELLRPGFVHRYRLGVLEPGAWRFVLRVNGIEECLEEFVVPEDPTVDDDPPEAELEAHDIDLPGDFPQRLRVTYRDRSGLDVGTIGDGDLVVYSPCVFDDVPDPVPCGWRAKRARFVGILSLSDDRREVVAAYEIDAPEGGWSMAHNGFYPVALWDDAVCDRLGNCVERQRLGGFEVRIGSGEPPVPAEAVVEVDPSDPDRVAAKVHIDFKEHWGVVEQDVRRVGSRIYLVAKAVPLPVVAIFPPPPPPQQDVFYDLGPLRGGSYGAIFVMNGHVYDVQRFEVTRDPPIPATADLRVDASDPAAVVAEVTIHFRTPHRVEQGAVMRDGHRIHLAAKAEPLPLDPLALPPEPVPVTLRYEVGPLPPGGYLALFQMNGYPYVAEDFAIDDPAPPIPAAAGIVLERGSDGGTVAVVRVKFETPHAIVDRALHRQGNRFVLEATAEPVPPDGTDPNGSGPLPVEELVTLRYPLGVLEPGDYGAAFVMNGWKYDAIAWKVPPPPGFEAEVELAVERNERGRWVATARLWFDDPHVRIKDPGEPVFDGSVISIDATAVISDTTDAPPVPFVLRYDLGELRPGGWQLKYHVNGRFEEQLDFIVETDPPVPAEAEIRIDPSVQPVQARVTVWFRDHYRVTEQGVQRLGNLILLDATAEGPLPILAPIPPPAVELDYPLGELDAGNYFAAFRINGHVYDLEEFRIGKGGFEAEVDLAVDVADEVSVHATVDFEDPYVVVTDPGVPVFDGNIIRIDATAERVVFIQEPSGDPVTHRYRLGELRPGRYELFYSINGHPEARTIFVVPPPCEVLPHVVKIAVEQGDASWFSKVVLALYPNQRVTDWGEVRREGDGFHVEITVECVDFPEPQEPEPLLGPGEIELPDGVRLAADGTAWVADVPVRLVRHDYLLGVLDPGSYAFFVHSGGATVARKAFEVPGMAPRVELQAETLTEPAGEYRFGISYFDPDGLDHESIMAAEVVVTGADGYRERARLVSYGSTDDVPSSGGFASYAVSGPGGGWDYEDNGGYRVRVDPEAIRDLHGVAIEDGRIGGFRVRILPPPPDPGVRVSVAPTAEGEWNATVEIVSGPGEQVVVDSWGPVVMNGQVFVALASAHLEPTDGPVEPLAHSYELGLLQPGAYLFVFTSSLGHHGWADFVVPGLEGDPVDRWVARAEGAPVDAEAALAGYYFALDPSREVSPRVRPEIVEDADGSRHLGLRFRRLHGAEGVRHVIEGTSDLVEWRDVSDRIDRVGREVGLDGTEEVLLCLRDELEKSELQYLRIRVLRDAD